MKTVQVKASKSYEVHIGSGLLAQLGQLISPLVKDRDATVISDLHVFEVYGSSLIAELKRSGFRVHHLSFPPGEQSKDMDTFMEVIRFLAENGCKRGGCVIALGGGVVGDLAGFAAACYMRGIPYVQVPTSLLAMVDSSVGGKTAVNLDLDFHKNICGAFHQPISVVCDIDALNTLPPENFREGCAEIIKYAILFDGALFAHLEDKGLDFDREAVIVRCIEQKAQLVFEDEFDIGRRRLLNLGHTIGHAIEAQSGFHISHGEAVATGLAIVTRAAEKMGYCDESSCERILSLIDKFGLPSRTVYSADTLLSHAILDKKAMGNSVHLIVPKSIGDCRIIPMDSHQLHTFIEAGL